MAEVAKPPKKRPTSLPLSKSNNPLLKDLQFDKNQTQTPKKLPSGTAIQRRPLNHPPVASPYAGASVQKSVYVSSRTPLMSAVKRVRKLLSHVEKRAMQDVDISKGRDGMKKLAEASEKLGKNGEVVHIRASGRAIEQAMRVAEWFRGREREMLCHVEVVTGSVQAVDDLVEIEEEPDDEEPRVSAEDGLVDEVDRPVDGAANVSKVTDTTFSAVPDSDNTADRSSKLDETLPTLESPELEENLPPPPVVTDQAFLPSSTASNGSNGKSQKKQRRARGKRKRDAYDKDDMPEARIRWISTVDVAISLKG